MAGNYQSALEAAGCVVHVFKEFGSYQGKWYAYVTHNQETGFITGWYGSCSGCDAFEAEFDYNGNDPVKLAEFGKTYLPVQDIAPVIEEVKKDMLYDSDAEEVYQWILKIMGFFGPNQGSIT